jgi:hypothetical protein
MRRFRAATLLLLAVCATACGALLGLSGDDDPAEAPANDAAVAADVSGQPAEDVTSAEGGCVRPVSGARSAVARASTQTKTIDGDFSDFGPMPAFVIDACTAAKNEGSPQATAEVRLEWSADALYVAVDVIDANREGTDATPTPMNDGVEIYVTPHAERNGCYGPNDRHYIIDHTGVAANYDSQNSQGLDGGVIPIAEDRVEVVPSARGYRVELAIDATIFGGPLTKGQTLFFDVLVNDNDGEAQVNWRTWAMTPFDAGGVCGCQFCGIDPAFDTRWLSPIVLE